MIHPSIVVTDDDTASLSLIKELLLDEGYPDVEYSTGPTAFDFIRQKQPGLVLLDININNATEGWKTLDFLRLHPDATNIPIIVCSTDARMLTEKADWLREMRCETQEKPFDLDTLLTKIASILGLRGERIIQKSSGVPSPSIRGKTYESTIM